MDTNEASPASETSLAAIVKTEEENSKISGRNYLCWSGRVRSTRGQAIEAWKLHKSNPSRVTWGGLSGDQHVSCPKLASPTGNMFLNHSQTVLRTLQTHIYNLSETLQQRNIIRHITCYLPLINSTIRAPALTCRSKWIFSFWVARSDNSNTVKNRI